MLVWAAAAAVSPRVPVWHRGAATATRSVPVGLSGLEASTEYAALAALAKTAKDDVRGIVSPDAEVPFLPESAFYIGAAFREWLGSSDPIAVGRDPRLSSPLILDAFCRGADAVDTGLATTPVMLESLLGPSAPYAGAAMVTASHLPTEWNGLKLFSRQLVRG